MSHDWYETRPHYGGIDLTSINSYGQADPFDNSFFNGSSGNPEAAAYWATLTLKQKIIGSLCSIAVGAGGAGLLIALVAYLH